MREKEKESGGRRKELHVLVDVTTVTAPASTATSHCGEEESDSEGEGAPVLTREHSSVLLQPRECERRRAEGLLAEQRKFATLFVSCLIA